jgi:hypothetical protein
MTRMILLSPEHVRSINMAARRLVETVPKKSSPGSPWRSDAAMVRSTPGGGGVQRAAILDDLTIEASAVLVHATLIVDGLADLLETAASRDGKVNTVAAAVVVRSVVELAGQAVWLLDSGIDGNDRCRRYLIWLFDDLKQLRYAIAGEPADPTLHALTVAAVDNEESALLGRVKAAKWVAKPQVSTANGSVEPACLLNEDLKREKLPSYTDLATGVVGRADAYSQLSAAAHGQRFARILSTTTDSDTGLAGMGGTSLPPSMLIRIGCSAVGVTAAALAKWCGLDLTRLRELTLPLAAPNGAGPDSSS